MKLYELYNKQPLREDTTLRASIRLCESVVKLLEGMEELDEARVTDPTALKVKEIATEMFGNPYSSARIGGGKIHRLSIPIRRMLSQSYRYKSLKDLKPQDVKKLRSMKDELMGAIENAGIDAWNVVDVKYHIGVGVYMSVRTTIDETVEEGINDGGGFDFEPDPAFAGVKGVTRDTGAGNLAANQAKEKAGNQKLNATWQTLVGKLGKLDYEKAKVLKMHLQKVADAATQRGFTLSPNPNQVLGL